MLRGREATQSVKCFSVEHKSVRGTQTHVRNKKTKQARSQIGHACKPNTGRWKQVSARGPPGVACSVRSIPQSAVPFSPL